MILIEKEFSQAGHLFAKRNRIFKNNKNEQSPIFVQFLDAVQNILKQYPDSFQFNLNFLSSLCKPVGSDLYLHCNIFTYFANSKKSMRLYDKLLLKKD